MSKATFLQIDGWWGGGKGVLQGLLDGHPAFAFNPIHEATHMTFLFPKMLEILKIRELKSVRNHLHRSGYYKLEAYALEQKVMFAFGANKVLFPKFDFDFYAFDKAWATELFKLETWTPEEVILLIHRAYAQQLCGKADWQYHYSMSWPFLNWQKNFDTVLPNSKSILVKRPVEQIIATRTGRIPIQQKATNNFAPGFNAILREREIHQIMAYYDMWEEQEKKHPHMFLTVQFEDLLFNRKDTMQRVAKFLNIPFDDNLLKWTFMGEELLWEGVGYADQVVDAPEEILSKDQLRTVRNEMDLYKKKRVDRLLLKIRHKLAAKFPST